MDATLRPATRADLLWANEAWERLAFVRSDPDHLLFVAWVGDIRAGVGRIVPVAGGTGELGGMYVDPTFRGRGIAGALVRVLLAHSPVPMLFCVPFAHLAEFYVGCGFRPVADGEPVPDDVARKVAWCATQYPQPVVVLRWHR